MKATQSALRLNELLDFVRPDPSAVHHLSLLILTFNTPHAAWWFIFDYYQPSMLARAQSIQATF